MSKTNHRQNRDKYRDGGRQRRPLTKTHKQKEKRLRSALKGHDFGFFTEGEFGET